MYEVLWYWFVAILEGSMSLKRCVAEYVYYEPDKIISAPGVYIIFQFFQIYFNSVIQDGI